MGESTTPTTRADYTFCIDPDDILDALEWNRGHAGQWKEFQFDKPLEGGCTPRVKQLSSDTCYPDGERVPIRLRPSDFIDQDSQFIMALPDSAVQFVATVDPDWSVETDVSTAMLVGLQKSIVLEDTVGSFETAVEVPVRYTADAELEV